MDEFEQHSKYVRAVNRMLENFIVRNTEVNKVALLERLIAEGADFHTLRRELTKASENNDNLCPSGSDEIAKNEMKKQEAIVKIENIILEIVTDIAAGKSPKLVIRNQTLWNNCIFGERISLRESKDCKLLTVNYKRAGSQNKFSLILQVLSMIHRMLINKTTRTRREIYYQIFSIVKNQNAVDRALASICCLLNCPQWELGIMSTSKGLIAGPIKITTKEGHIIDCMNAGGILIPQDVIGIKNIKSQAKFILVIEKDATFQKMLDDGALERLRPCILLTGKGYPDINTRLMLKFLVDTLNIPSLALVDADPHGIEIMCVYRFGSRAMSHISEKLAVPSLRWLGVHPSDVINLGAPILPLTSKDISKCKDLLLRPYCSEGSKLRDEVNIILKNKMKTELEGIDTISQAYLTDTYIHHKLYAQDFI